MGRYNDDAPPISAYIIIYIGGPSSRNTGYYTKFNGSLILILVILQYRGIANCGDYKLEGNLPQIIFINLFNAIGFYS